MSCDRIAYDPDWKHPHETSNGRWPMKRSRETKALLFVAEQELRWNSQLALAGCECHYVSLSLFNLVVICLGFLTAVRPLKTNVCGN